MPNLPLLNVFLHANLWIRSKKSKIFSQKQLGKKQYGNASQTTGRSSDLQ
jgi:hypothetical protein